jgi:endonuclease I
MRLPDLFVQRIACASLLLLPPCASAGVFVNELHYDNANTDTSEKIEVLAPAGTSLAGWSIALYNGSDGTRYATLSLSGTVANQCGGFGTATVAATGIQNGAPDGLALIDASGAVVQFLSYEGTFTATNGPAAGLASSAITQSESANTAAGTSLQLAGSGSQYADFSWQASRTSSFGACNAGQSPSGGDGGGGGGGGGNVLQNGVPVTGLSASTGSSVAYTLSVPAGATNLHVASAGGTGDADLYVRFGAAPTTSVYDCRPYLYGNSESCDVAAPQAGTWYVMLRAYTSFSGASLSAGFTPPSGGGGGGGTGDAGTYYDGIDTTNAAALRAGLHALIDGQAKIPYTASTTDTWDVLAFADEDPANPADVIDIYRNASYPKAAGGNDAYNREHTWPNSLGFPDDGPTNFPYTDLHMLMAADIAYNADRGNLPYGNCNASCTEYPTIANDGRGGGSGTFPGNSNWSNGTVWQAWRGMKGNVARAVLYMDVRYEGGNNPVTGTAEPDLRLTDNAALVAPTGGNASVAYMGLLSVLLQWNQEDPVDDAERLRNDAVQSYQGNRNPFVDHPEWAACIYQSVCN